MRNQVQHTRSASQKARATLLPIAAVLCTSAGGCDLAGPSYGDINVSSNIEAADGLDLKAVGELVKQAKDAEDLEKRLNESGGVNNLDLNEDGKVDFIHVTEYGGEAAKGFSLTVQPEKGETQEIATIEVEKKGEGKDATAAVDVRGNEQVYGPHHHYHYGASIGSMLLMAYLFRPHPFYISPFHWGHYPGYYGLGHPRVGHTVYRTRAKALTGGSTAARVETPRKSNLASPNRGKSAGRGIRASLRNPSQSQRAFRTVSKMPGSTKGFGQRVGTRGTSVRRNPSGMFGSGSRRGFGRSFGSRGFRSRR